jgi:hypothetical protein
MITLIIIQWRSYPMTCAEWYHVVGFNNVNPAWKFIDARNEKSKRKLAKILESYI